MPFQQRTYRRCAQTVLGIALGILVSWPTLGQAFSIFVPPPNRGIPGRRVTAGTRSDCLPLDKINPNSTEAGITNQKRMESLVPVGTLEQTIAEYPTLTWYLPRNSLSQVELTVVEADSGQPLYQTLIEVNERSGIMSYTLPKSAIPPLKLNTPYKWSIRGICGSDGLPGQVGGQFQRIAPSPQLTAALQQANPASVPQIYGAAGLWYDMLASLLQLRQANPKDARLAKIWSELMREIELEYMAKESLAPQDVRLSQPNRF